MNEIRANMSELDWSDVGDRAPLWINLGARENCDPATNYEGWIGVDIEPKRAMCVQHDLREPIPLPDASVDRIVSEHCFEHIDRESARRLLDECYRLLRPGGLLRVSVPDYGHPRERQWLGGG